MPAPRLPGPRRRRQLLDVALQVFAKHGYHDTSMDEVAEAAGVTKPVLYQHFPSKRALYLELLGDVGAQLLEALVRAARESRSPRRQVEAGFAAYFRLVAARESAFRLLFASAEGRDAEFACAVRRVEDGIATAVASLIQADIDEDHRLMLAHALVGIAEGTSRHWLAHDLDCDPDVLARRVASFAWAGLRDVRRT